MSARRGLVVINGGQASRDGRYLVASEAMIISVLGMLQLSEPGGVSLNKLHQTLDRVREGKPMVDWYALRNSLIYLENDGRLKAHQVRRGNLAFQVYQLADWEVWWHTLSRQLL